ncbi:MAG: hypothetical protein ABIO55_15275 [Ginsengibacter sp.]
MAAGSRNIIVQQDTISKEVILPFHALLSLLRQNGFSIKPDDYIEILKITEKFGSDNLQDIGPLICPLIATSPEEQQKFYKVFEQYISTEPELTTSHIKPPRAYKKWLIAVACIATALLIIFFIKKDFFKNRIQHTISADFTLPEYSQYRVGDTIEVDAGSTFLKEPSYRDKVKLLWNAGNGWKEDSVKKQVILQHEGYFVIQLKIQSDAVPIKDNLKKDSIYVCPAKPKITLYTRIKNEYLVGDSLIVTAEYSGKKLPFDKIFWKVNDDTLSYNNPILRYQFKSAGDYSVSFGGITNVGIFNRTNSPCINGTYLNNYGIITVREKNEKIYTLAITPTGNRISPAAKVRLNALLNWLFIIPALVVFLGTLIWWRRKKLKQTDEQKSGPLKFEGRQLPYETPFENRDLQLVNKENIFNEVFRSFRQKAEDEAAFFNVNKTIRSTIQAGGFPKFVFTNKLCYNDYLILIDHGTTNDQQTQLFNYLVSVLNEEAITVERFYYKESIEQLSNEEFSEGISLKRLSELYKRYTLIIMGNAWQLVYKAYPVLEKKIADVLNEWEYKAILTPVGYKDWGEKENLIRQKIILLPADIKGQIKLIQAIREQQLNHEKYLSSIEEFYEAQSYDFEVAEELESYLGDKVLFQWLCGVCVFHKLRWEIVVEMGKAICAKYGEPEKMNYTNLLKLARISWMHEGVFPGVIRMELLKRLTAENEIVARETLLKMLEYSDIYFGKGYFFEEEKEIQKITNRFVLFAHDQEKYQEFLPEQKRFKALWDNDQILDTPQKAYLDKHTGDNWSTLIEQDGKSVGVDEYLNQQWIKKLHHYKKVLLRNAAIALSLMVILGCLHLFKNKLPSNTPLPLVYTENSFTYSILLDDSVSCAGQNNKTEVVQALSGNLTIAKTSFPLSFEKTNNNKWLATGSTNLLDTNGVLKISWNNGKKDQSLAENVILSSEILRAGITGCESAPVRTPLSVRYNNAAAYAAIENQLKATLNEFDINATREDFKDLSHISYYAGDQKLMADSIVKRMAGMGFNVKEEFTQENKIPASVLTLYLNLASTACNTISLNALPQSLNEIWHGGTSNRLINIDLVGKIIYYSTGDKKTYGTYRTNEVCVSNGVYRVITKANNQYEVFLFRNLKSSSFELSVCQNRYNTKEEALAVDESYCDRFNQMSLYYESTPGLIFVPKDAKKYVASETRKVALYLKDSLAVNAVIYVNPLNASPSSSQLVDRGLFIRSNGILTDKGKFGMSKKTAIVFSGTPFDRDYIRLEVAPLIPRQPTEGIDCNRTFTSIKEALSVKAEVICKLDLSNQKLTAIPKEIYSFKNLQQLDLRNNPIPQTEIDQLKKTFPKATIQFTPEVKEPGTTQRQLLANISLGKDNYPDKPGVSTLTQIINYLKNYPTANIEIAFYYSNSYEQETAFTAGQKWKPYLQKEFGKFNINQIKFTPQKSQAKQQSNQSNTISPGNYIGVFGTGFPQNFLNTLNNDYTPIPNKSTQNRTTKSLNKITPFTVPDTSRLK